MTLLAREEYVNATEGYHFGDSGEPSECFTDDLGRLYRQLRGEYGRATNIYVDTKSGIRHVGWCFTKRMRYEGVRDERNAYYTREVWVTLYESCDVESPAACVSTRKNGAVTRHPFTMIDIDAYRKRRAS